MSRLGVKESATTARQRATFLLEVALDEAQIKERLAAALREWRGRRSQLDVYAETGLSYRQYQRLENAQSLPRWRTLEAIAERTGIDLADIVGDGEERETLTSSESDGLREELAEVRGELAELRRLFEERLPVARAGRRRAV